jgi:hypothetical protein
MFSSKCNNQVCVRLFSELENVRSESDASAVRLEELEESTKNFAKLGSADVLVLPSIANYRLRSL